MSKIYFAIDLGNKSAKMKSGEFDAFAIPSRYINEAFVDGAKRFNSISDSFKQDRGVKKYKLVNADVAFYFGQGINDLGKDDSVRESFGMGKQRYEGQKFKDMLSYCIAELAYGFKDEITKAELVLGLPSEDFTEANIKTVVKYAKNQHSVEIDGKVVNVKITKVHVLPQPIGTFYDLIIDNNGKLVRPELIPLKIAIADIGGLTKLYDSLQNFVMDSSEREQKDSGIWTLYNMISDMLEVDSAVKPNKYQIEKIVRSGIDNNSNNFIFKPNKTASEESVIDITTTVKKAIDLYTEQTIDEITNIFTHFSTIDILVFTGGGSKILNKELLKEAFPSVELVFSDGEFSNVNGFYKYALTQMEG